MPAYGTPQPGGGATALSPGDAMRLFDAEILVAPQASIPFLRALSGDSGTTFTIGFAAAPTAVVAIQGANVDLEAQYQTLFTSTDKQTDSYTNTERWRYYRARLVSQAAGGALTVIAQR